MFPIVFLILWLSKPIFLKRNKLPHISLLKQRKIFINYEILLKYKSSLINKTTISSLLGHPDWNCNWFARGRALMAFHVMPRNENNAALKWVRGKLLKRQSSPVPVRRLSAQTETVHLIHPLHHHLLVLLFHLQWQLYCEDEPELGWSKSDIEIKNAVRN